MALLAYVDRIGFSVFAQEIGRDFHLTAQDVANLMAAFMISYGACQVPMGLAGDWFGARLLLPLFVVGWSLATAAVGLVPPEATPSWLPLYELLALRLAFGTLQSGAFPVFTRVVADWMPLTERATAQGLMWTTSRLGAAFIPYFLFWLLGLCGGWRLPFAILAGLGLLWSAAFWFWFRNRPEEMPHVNAAERALIRAGQPPTRGPAPRAPWRRILDSRSVWCLCLMYGGCGPAGNFMLLLLPYYLLEQRHLPPKTVQWLLGVPLAAGFVACSLGGVVSDRLIRWWGSRKWGRRANGLLGLTVAGLAFASTVWVEDPWLLGLLLCLTQFGNDFCMGPAWAACADVGERYAGTVSGAMNMTGSFSGAVAASMAGYLILHGHADWAFLAGGGTYVLGALCWLGIDVTKPVKS
jgi:sugar phosphate permease